MAPHSQNGEEAFFSNNFINIFNGSNYLRGNLDALSLFAETTMMQ